MRWDEYFRKRYTKNSAKLLMRFIKFVSIARSTPLYIRQVPDTAVIATMPQR